MDFPHSQTFPRVAAPHPLCHFPRENFREFPKRIFQRKLNFPHWGKHFIFFEPGWKKKPKIPRKSWRAEFHPTEATHLQGVESLFQVISTFFPLSRGRVKFAPPVDEFLLLQPEIPKLPLFHKENPGKTAAAAPRFGKRTLHQPHP